MGSFSSKPEEPLAPLVPSNVLFVSADTKAREAECLALVSRLREQDWTVWVFAQDPSAYGDVVNGFYLRKYTNLDAKDECEVLEEVAKKNSKCAIVLDTPLGNNKYVDSLYSNPNVGVICSQCYHKSNTGNYDRVWRDGVWSEKANWTVLLAPATTEQKPETVTAAKANGWFSWLWC